MVVGGWLVSWLVVGGWWLMYWCSGWCGWLIHSGTVVLVDFVVVVVGGWLV